MKPNVLEILKYPDPRLNRISAPVKKFDAALHELLDRMLFTMYEASGIGLAAPQVNQLIRAFVIDLQLENSEGEETREVFEFINPRILSGEGKIVYDEGCLSVPGLTEEVTRRGSIKVLFQNRDGAERTLEAEGLLAVAIQHENDHLEGILFMERLSPLKRRLVKRRLNKALQE